ncbi:MAG: NTP transferase domain-containing protein [Xanthomonadales bacterium]|nr:NTP transferase domain-containing protein [Xanthomonadales bacterium]
MAHCNSKPPVSLVILAAGLGRRFGGDKQLVSVAGTGKPLMYFSVMDAYRLGVRQLVLVINHLIEQAILKQFVPLLPHDLKVSLVQQQVDDLPEGCEAYSRQKPWGTGHALWSARDAVPAGCIVINADDYYGPDAMTQLLLHLKHNDGWALVSYPLKSTLSDSGEVNRGLCQVTNGSLVTIRECLSIKLENGGICGEIDGKSVNLEPKAPVSMNIWAFGSDIFDCLNHGLIEFFSVARDQSQVEFYLPAQVMVSIKEGRSQVRVYSTKDKWQGITYPEDLERLGKIFRPGGDGLDE